MVAVEEMNSKNLTDVVESAVESLKDGLYKTLGRSLKWTLHPSEGDAVSEMGRAEMVFVMLVNALARLDTEISGVLLKEADRWSIFPRVTRYMSGKMDAEWRVPRETIDRASRFAHVLELSGLFSVPPELRAYLAQLLAEDGGGDIGAEDYSQESKRPRKDPRGPQQVEESPAGGQASGEEPQQERRYKLAARRRRRSRKQGGRGQEKGKQASSHQQVLTPSLQSISEPTPGPSKIQTSSYPLHTDKPTGTIPKVPQQAKSSAAIPVPNPATGAIPKVPKVTSAGCQTEEPTTPAAVEVTSAVSRTLPLPREARQRSPVDRIAAVPFPRARQVTSAGCQTEEPPTPAAVEVTSAASQTLPLPRVSKEEAQRQLWRGVREDDGELIEGAVLSGADMEEKGVDRLTALSDAAAEGRMGAVRALVRLGAQLEWRDGAWGRTALHWASVRGHEEVVRLLLEAGASAVAKTKERTRPLHLASFWGYLPVVKLLVEAGANINHRDRRGCTPLSEAEGQGHYAVAECLRSARK